MIKNIIIAVVGIIFASLLYIAFVPATSPFVGPVACTEEAMICPDGTAVGRTGPTCEFAPCPMPKPVTFTCQDNKSIVATFSESAVLLTLSDGRSITLPEAPTDTGERAFLNEEGSVGFWTRDYSAFVREGNVETYSACVVSSLTFPEL